MAELTCPLCHGRAAEGAEIAAARCPSCGARFAGGTEDPPTAVAAASESWTIETPDARLVADGLFRLAPDEPLLERLGITTDRRDGFYRWWVFVAEGADPAAAFSEAASHGLPRA